jgi:hypothetical protein
MAMQTRVVAPVLALVISTLATPLAAHHSVRATFDGDTLVTLAGTVRSVEWINPHTLFVVDAHDATGSPVAWTVEIGAPSALIRQGFSRDFIEAGDTLTLEVWTAKDGSPNAHARSIVFADGSRIDLPEDRWMEGTLKPAAN